MVLMRTAPQFSHKSPGKLVVLLRTAARFSQKYVFKKHPLVKLKRPYTDRHKRGYSRERQRERERERGNFEKQFLHAAASC